MAKGPIPRVLHRIWLGGPMPPEFEAYGESWRRLHPGWRHVLWTEQNLPKLINQKEFDAAHALAQKADIARYEILYEQGGVYVDCDFECYRPIDDLLEGVHCFAATEDLTWISIGILGAVPKHPLLKATIDEIPRSVATQQDAPINIQTGPLLFTRVVAARRMRLERDDLVVFPPKVFYPYRFGQKRPARDQMPDAYGAHHWAASWMRSHHGVSGTQGAVNATAAKGGELAAAVPAASATAGPAVHAPGTDVAQAAGTGSQQLVAEVMHAAGPTVHPVVEVPHAAGPTVHPVVEVPHAARTAGDVAATTPPTRDVAGRGLPGAPPNATGPRQAVERTTSVDGGGADYEADSEELECLDSISLDLLSTPVPAPEARSPIGDAGAACAQNPARAGTASVEAGRGVPGDASKQEACPVEEKFRVLAALDPDKPDPVLLLLVAFGRLFQSGDPVELGIYAYSEPSLPLLQCVQQLLGMIIGDLTKTAELSLLSRSELSVLPYQVAFVPSGNAVEDARTLFDAVRGLGLIRQTVDALREGKQGPTLPTPMRRDVLARRAAKRPQSPEGLSTEAPPIPRGSAYQGLRGAYIGEDRVLVHTTYGRPLIAAARDRSITPELMVSGCYDQPLVRFLSNRLAPGDVAFDIGANIGFFTVLMGSLVGPDGRVVAYEASPALFALLVENLTTNYMNDRATALPLAAWSEAKRLVFHISERFCGNGSVRAKDEAYRRMYPTDRIRSIEVDAESLDQRWSKLERIEVVKIDVEGAELQVLRGMHGLIRAGAVRCVVFECIRSHLGSEWSSFVELLRSFEQEFHMGFSTIASDGRLQSLTLEELASRGNFTQVVMERRP